MTLNPKAKALLTAIQAAAYPALTTMPAARAREVINDRFSKMNIPVKRVGGIADQYIPGEETSLKLRIYTPEGQGPFPVMMWFHGGGWVLFNIDHYDSICTHLCHYAGIIVVSVDYRLAPEHRFPAAVNDCSLATRWILGNASSFGGDPGRVIVAGDSAGGNLAAVTSLRMRDSLAGQVLIYPVTDYYEPETGSYRKFADDYALTRSDLFWFWDKYIRSKGDVMNPEVAPLKATSLEGLPPALVMLAGYDPLYDEGLAYAEKLKAAGVPTKLIVHADMMHGFLSYLGIFPQAAKAVREIGEWVKGKKVRR